MSEPEKSTLAKFRLDGRVAILTGGIGLLGRQFTRTLVGAGARVVIADRDAKTPSIAAGLAKECGGEVIGESIDITQAAEVNALVARTVERWQKIDILINNAAIDPKFDVDVAGRQANTFEDYPLELWKQSLDVNLTGAFLCCQAVGKVMVRQKRGVIINISSTYGVVAPDQRLYQRDGEAEQKLFKPASYAVTKAGIAHFSRYLAAYWAGQNIRVNTLTPHGIFNAQDEQFTRRYNERSTLERMATVDEMNGAILFLASDASSYMTGSNLVVDGGWTAW
ncbi:MAG TPA: SDR family oxidoreductase [Pirellulales bacterium]|nr:SDR family oxidoreductase [Pirellulales bacterium]